MGGLAAKFSLTDAGAPATNPATQLANDADLIQRIMVRLSDLGNAEEVCPGQPDLESRWTLTQQAAANNLKAQIPANQSPSGAGL
jgi:hypothetical protein